MLMCVQDAVVTEMIDLLTQLTAKITYQHAVKGNGAWCNLLLMF